MHRWYLEFAALSCGTVHRERIDTTADDRKRGHNRAEHLRQHVKADDGDSVYERRPSPSGTCLKLFEAWSLVVKYDDRERDAVDLGTHRMWAMAAARS
ncbi:MAG TPA: hypothetical protein VFQ37_04185 [Mycobacterium sp.]|nr:hypothetical protein [Mycobacterium sp.]